MKHLTRLALVLAFGFVAFPAADAHATHFRYGTIRWFAAHDAQPRHITIQMDSAWRRDAFIPAPAVNGTVNLNVLNSATFGVYNASGALIQNLPMTATVTTVNAAENWFIATSSVTVDLLPPVTAFRITFNDCCRLSTLRDNNAVPFTLTANGSVTTSVNRSPVSGILPIVTLRLNAPNTFTIPANDPDGDPVTFFFPTVGLAGSGLNVPRPTTLNMTSAGVVTWQPSVAGLYAMQVTAADGRGATVPIDFVMNVIDAPATATPPAIRINNQASPPQFTVLAGTPLAFTVDGQDTDLDIATGVANSFVTISSGSLPSGSTLSPSLPFNARSPLSSTFTWTPQLSQAGNYSLTFAATDSTGLQSLTGVNVTVLANSRPVVGCPVVPPFTATSATGASVNLDVAMSDVDGDQVHTEWTVDGGATVTGPTVDTKSLASAAVTANLPLGNHTIAFFADDDKPFGNAQCQSSVSVVSANQHVEFGAAGPFTYGAGPGPLAASASSGLPVTLTVLSGPGILNGSDLTFTGAGPVVVEATQGGDSWRTPAAPVTQTITVSPAALTVRANNAQRPYGGTEPAFGATIAGFVNGQDASALAGTLSFATSATAASHVGTYTITPFGLRAANYAIAYADGTLDITAAPLTVHARSESRPYGSANPAFTATVEGFVLGDEASVLRGTLAFATEANEVSPVGVYSVTPSGLTSSDYAIRFVNGTLDVAPSRLTVTADDDARMYGAADPAFSASYSGFVNGEDAGVLAGSLVFSTAPAASGVGAYPIHVSGPTSPNYDVRFVDGTLTVTAAPLVIRANDAAWQYGVPSPAFTARFEGFVPGENESALTGSLVYSTAPFRGGVGSNPIRLSGVTSNNYAIAFVDGTLTVTAAPLTVTAHDATRQYGAPGAAFSVSVTGFMQGDDESVLSGPVSFSTTAGSVSPVGTYAVSASGLTAANYDVRYVDGTLTITPAGLTVNVRDASKVYGSANPAFTASFSGWVNGDDANTLSGTLAFATGATAGSGAETYPISASGLSSANYAISYVDGTLTVHSAPMTVTAIGASRVYGTTNPAFSAVYAGFVLGQDAAVLGGSLSFATAALPSSNVGAYTVIPSGVTSPNYTITFLPGTLTVRPAPLTVKANDASKLQGAPNPPFTATFTGLVLGQDAPALSGTPAFTTTATMTSGPGTYLITPSGVSSPNYAITFVNGTLSVFYNVCLEYDATRAAHGGSTIPIKLRLCDVAGNNLFSPAVIPHAVNVRNLATGVESPASDASNANPGGNFRVTGDRYIFNLTTTGLASADYRLVFQVNGAEYAVPFAVR
jgi:hypothetical protein